MRIRLPSAVLAICIVSSAFAATTPENLALRARVIANSEYNAQYRAAFVADGIVPRPMRKDGAGKEWAVQGATHKNGAELTMTWPSPVTISPAE